MPIRWEKFEKLRKASDLFDDCVRYLRRYTRSVEPFAAFVSALNIKSPSLTWRRFKAMPARPAVLMRPTFATQWSTRLHPSVYLVV